MGKTLLTEKTKTSKSGSAPKCDVCDTVMKPSLDGKGNPIWICPLDPTHGTKPRIVEG